MAGGMARIRRALSVELIGDIDSLTDEHGAVRIPATVDTDDLLELFLELGGEDVNYYDSSEMLIWDIGRKLGFYIPDYPLESNSEVRKFLNDFGVEDVPAWYELLGVPHEVSHEFWKYAAICARDEHFWRRILLFPKAHMRDAGAFAVDVRTALEHCLAPTPEDTSALFRI